MIKYIQLPDKTYHLETNNGSLVGKIEPADDGFLYFWPELRAGFWSEELMRDIADKLKELNKPYNDELNQYFSTHQKDIDYPLGF